MTRDDRNAPGEGLTLAEVALRAGISAELAAEIVKHGVIDATADGEFTERAVRRLRIVDQLVRGGLPLEALAEGRCARRVARPSPSRRTMSVRTSWTWCRRSPASWNSASTQPSSSGPVELKGLAEPVRLHVAHLA